MLNVFAVSGLAAVLLAAPLTARQAAPAPPDVSVEVVAVNGSGCPSGTTTVTPVDATTFQVTFESYWAMVGAGALATDGRKTCQVRIDVAVPVGWQYAVAQADLSGYAWLASGATGNQRANYYFDGTTPTAYHSHTFAGPLADSWHTTDTTELAAMSFSPCGGGQTLNIYTELRVVLGTSAKDSTSILGVGEQLTPTLTWREC